MIGIPYDDDRAYNTTQWNKKKKKKSFMDLFNKIVAEDEEQIIDDLNDSHGLYVGHTLLSKAQSLIRQHL